DEHDDAADENNYGGGYNNGGLTILDEHQAQFGGDGLISGGVGQGSFKVYCYLFVRCDNKPAPWTSDEHGDPSRPLPKLEDAIDMFERNETLSWNCDCHWISDFELWIIHCDLGKRKIGFN
ncbi:unnamed protein product, partial [Brassica napus]